nr:unnamed protein product [Brassica oleracea]
MDENNPVVDESLMSTAEKEIGCLMENLNVSATTVTTSTS